MADRVLYTQEAAIAEATVIQLSLADAGAVPPVTSVIRLFDSSFVPNAQTAKAALLAAETTLIGYPVGGYPITAYVAPIFAPGGGVVIQSQVVNVVYASGAAVAIGGYWVEDGAGDVREIFIYDPVRALTAVGDGWPIIAQFGYGRNA